MGVEVVSFDVEMSSILRYAFNVFGSTLPILYLFVGASFGGFVLGLLLNIIRRSRNGD